MQASSSPPRAPPMKYPTEMGTRWQRELQAAGGLGAFEHPDDPKFIGPWIIGECVGKGANGRVKIAKHKRTGQLAAVKILPLQPLVNSRASLATNQAKSDKQRLGIDKEITMMKLMDHPNIMRIYDVYEGDKELYLVLEYVEGGELFDLLVNRGRLHPLEALTYFKQLVYGLNYAHTFSIIHRDLKPENILIHSLDPPLIKLADWGMAAFAPPALQLETHCGSPHYASPEIVNGEKYEGTATDIWSCGVVLFALLTARLPFDDNNMKALLEKVRAGKYEIPPYIDPYARDLLSGMLTVDVTQRITIPEILSHPWLSFPTPGPLPTLPPHPSRLARPLRSPSHIDRDLLESLRIIWGKHANVSTIKCELLAPPGKGTLAKAFYFLLERYRERAEGGDGERERVCKSMFEGSLLGGKENMVAKHYAAPVNSSLAGQAYPPSNLKKKLGDVPGSTGLSPAPPMYSYNRTQHPRHIQIQPQPQRASSTLAPPVMQNNPSRPPSSRGRQPSPVGPRPAKGRPVSCDGPRPGRRPTPTQTNDPSVQVNIPAQAQTQMYTNVHLRRERILTTDSPMEMDVSSVRFPVQFGYENEHEHKTGPPAVDASRTKPNVIHAPVPAYPPLPMLTAPRTENVELQRTINHITDRVNVLVARQNQGEGREKDWGSEGVQDEVRWSDGPPGFVSVEAGSGSSPHGGGRVRIEESAGGERGRERDRDKENRHRGGTGYKPTAGMAKEKVNMGEVVNGNGGKGLKEKKLRPPTLDLHHPISHKRSTLSSLASPTLTSPPALFSPVVGEFKGWFSNLFNWKLAQHVLYSPEDPAATRAETVRLLEQFGVVVALEEGLLRCRVEEGATGDGGGVQKRAWFKVEFAVTGLGAVHTPHLPHGLGLSPNMNPIPSFSPSLSPNPVSPNPNSSLNGSSARSAILQVGHVPGSVCAIVLVQEKGSVSGFRTVCRRLKEEWRVGGACLMSPTMEHAQGVF